MSDGEITIDDDFDSFVNAFVASIAKEFGLPKEQLMEEIPSVVFVKHPHTLTPLQWERRSWARMVEFFSSGPLARERLRMDIRYSVEQWCQAIRPFAPKTTFGEGFIYKFEGRYE